MASRQRRGTAQSTPFCVGDIRLGMARMPVLPDRATDAEALFEPVVAEGMFLSSEMQAGSSSKSNERRRATTARAFQIRARRRTTPQGVFAAVANLEIGDHASQQPVHPVRARTYPNPLWLHQVLDTALDNPCVLRCLTFTVNNLLVRRGDRLEIACRSDDPRTGPHRVSIRATKAINAMVEVCAGGVSWRQLADVLAQTWPNLPEESAASALRTLARNGFILTDLAPTDPCNDPIGQILDKLPHDEPLRKKLSDLRLVLHDADAYPPGHAVRLAALQRARQQADGMAPSWRPLCVDTTGDTSIRISTDTAEQAAKAASLLWRLAPGNQRLADWHERFLHRYGARRLVRLQEVCDPVTGLGCQTSDPNRSQPDDTTAVLAGLLHDALALGRLEVCLDDATIAALDKREPSDRPESSAELYAHVVAVGAGDRDAQPFLAVSGMASPAGATRARFAGLLTTPSVKADTGNGPMTAELAFQPLTHTAAALTGPTDSSPWRIPIGRTPRTGDLLMDELAVVSDGQLPYLWSIRHQRPVIPIHHNRLGHHLMPPLAAFLCLLGQYGTVALSPWTWGLLDNAPFVPRVRWHNIILSPARWRLPEQLRRAATEKTAWNNVLSDWRTGTHPAPPKTVVLEDADRQLPLDLDRGDDRELFRRYLARGIDAVTEQPGGDDADQAVASGPGGLHRLEIVVPLSANVQPGNDSEADNLPHAPVHVRKAGDGMFLPGGQWLSLAIDAPPSTQDAVLEQIVTVAHDTDMLWDRWFWLRYNTAERGPHLRVRFHGKATVLGGELLPVLHRACARAISNALSGGFAVEPYDQEIERYGGHQAIEAAESIFCCDSDLVAAILADNSDAEERLALTAVSAATIARSLADGNRLAMTPFQLVRADRHIQARIRPRCRALDDNSPPCGSLWEARDSALKLYRDLIPPARRVDCASSLIHMHANRMLGDNHQERIARALAADLIARKTA